MFEIGDKVAVKESNRFAGTVTYAEPGYICVDPGNGSEMEYDDTSLIAFVKPAVKSAVKPASESTQSYIEGIRERSCKGMLIATPEWIIREVAAAHLTMASLLEKAYEDITQPKWNELSSYQQMNWICITLQLDLYWLGNLYVTDSLTDTTLYAACVAKALKVAKAKKAAKALKANKQ